MENKLAIGREKELERERIINDNCRCCYWQKSLFSWLFSFFLQPIAWLAYWICVLTLFKTIKAAITIVIIIICFFLFLSTSSHFSCSWSLYSFILGVGFIGSYSIMIMVNNGMRTGINKR